VRELENLIERAMILSHGEPLRFDDIGTAFPRKRRRSATVAAEDPLDLDTVTKRHIERVLAMTDGKIHGLGGAGEILGVNPNTLRSKMKKLGIPFGKQRQPG
jgi:DNA-binding NtrC family response regulator